MYTPNTKFVELIAPANKGDTEDFFSMILDSNPLDKPGVDYNVSLEMRPLQVVYNMALLDKIGNSTSIQKPNYYSFILHECFSNGMGRHRICCS
jgi:hypothetical protein